jgi:hypothetical protein
MGFSGTVRLIIDFALDQDPELGLPALIDERKAVRAKLAALDASIADLETKQKAGMTNAPERVFEEVTNQVTSKSSRTSPKSPLTDKRPGLTEEERFLKGAPYVANGDQVVTPEMKTRILTQARDHPEWLEKVQEPQRNKIEAMLKIPKIGGREG